jgi:Fe-S oxidoreductase
MHAALFYPFPDAGQLFVFRVFVILSLALFVFLIGRRISLLFKAKKDPRLAGIGQRIAAVFYDGILQPRQWRYRVSGFLHLLIFWGFIVLSWRSASLLAMGLFPGFVPSNPPDAAAAVYTSIKEFFEVLVLFACGAALVRRAVARPDRYQGSRQADAVIVLSLIGILMASDMAFEGSSMLLSGHESGWHFSASIFKTCFSGLETGTLQQLITWSFWVHMAGFFIFLNFLPLSKHFHILTALPNVFLRKRIRGEAKPPRWESIDIETLDEAGVGRIPDMTWKQILDLFACTECGRCTDHCPAHAVGRDLSPKQVIMALRDRALGHFIPENSRNKNTGDGGRTQGAGDLLENRTIWACTTCGACEAQCPVFVEHVDKFIDLRRYRVLMKSEFPPELESMFRNLEIFGDPWGNGAGQRSRWADGLDIPLISEEQPMETLLWVGCAGAYNDQYQQVIRTLVRILKAGGVAFGILGQAEQCCGDVARRTGNEYLFQQMARKNIDRLKKAGVQRIITACPHGFNTLKNEYPRFGGQFQVLHHSQMIQELLGNGRLTAAAKLKSPIIYHDPCYLGRYNGIYDSPREILGIIGGQVNLEADRNRAQGFCCGAGGGYMYLVESGRRVNEVRAAQLVRHDAEIVATACPFCHNMLQEAMGALPAGTRIPRVRDIAQLVGEVI